MEDCKHLNFRASVDVNWLHPDGQPDNITGYTADIKVWCNECGQQFEFIGIPAGLSFKGPVANADFTEARLPIRPSTGKIATTYKVDLTKDSPKRDDQYENKNYFIP